MIARTTHDFRLSFWPRNYRRLICRKVLQGHRMMPCRAHKIIRTPGGHPAVSPRRWHNDRSVALRRDGVYNGYHQLFHSFQYDVSNTTTQSDSIANGVKTESEALIVALAVFRQQQARQGHSRRTVWMKPWLLRRVTLGHYDTLMQELMRESRLSTRSFL